MDGLKQLPYGVSDFVEVQSHNLYYVDKTRFIPLLEKQAANLFLIRPRRFGKSLFLSMLKAYYDISMKSRFHELFSDLWIGSQPTTLQGVYQILYLDLSRVTGSSSELKENFNEYFGIQLDGFMDKYESFYSPEVVKRFRSNPNPNAKLDIINNEARYLGNRLYLIVDEYDNFTNVVLNEEGSKVYRALTHAGGFYRGVFKKFKGMFERIFMMGVSPVTLDDLTSGFNIGWSISTDPYFNMILGFSEQEVRTMLQYYKDAGEKIGDIDEMIADMKPWYNNYCFAEESLKTDPKMFNSDMVLYYIKNYMRSGEAPKNMLDANTRTDYSKMKKLIRLDKLDGDRKGVIRRIAEEGKILAAVESSFPAEQLTRPDKFVSLLFYYGMLTISGVKGDRLILAIPNNNVRKQYYEYMLEQYEASDSINLDRLKDYYDNMAFDGQWQEALQYIADAYKTNSSVRSSIEGERNIQGFVTAFLSICNYYLTYPEVELNHGYSDLFLLPNKVHYPEVEHSYIIELKYLSAADFAAKAEEQWTEAIKQIHSYAQGPQVMQMAGDTKIHCIIMQFKGWEMKRMEEV